MHVTAQDLAALPNREALIQTLRTTLPGLDPNDTALGSIRGGRRAALAALAAVKPEPYARTRNFLAGQVTRLSPYLRHGVLTLAEVRDHALTQVRNTEQAAKLIQELAWRDYWQRLYAELGEAIWQDREPYKTGFQPRDYTAELPTDLGDGTTTLACMDAFSADLRTHGYLHNHVRMWTAAYLIHWRRVRWQAGARWFLEHLLDGDPASNNLSWQWVASTFASKPYLFNRENLERYTDSAYCRTCIHAKDGTCPFEASYEDLGERLFPRLTDASAMPQGGAPAPRTAAPRKNSPSVPITGKPLLWVHRDALNPADPIFATHPQGPALFTWDPEWITKEKITLKRTVFLAECLAEMPAILELTTADPAAALLAAAKSAGATHILAARTPDPGLLAVAAKLERTMPIVWTDPPPFVDSNRGFELKRFSRYWQRAESSAMQPTRP